MRRNLSLNRSKQTGSVLVVSIFIITIMAMMAAAMTKINWSQADTTTQEILGSRAWFAAHSGIEISLNKIFPIGDPSKISSCDVVATNKKIPITLVDFIGCEVEVICTDFGIDVDTSKAQRIRLESTGRCGNGDHQVSRVQEVWVKGL